MGVKTTKYVKKPLYVDAVRITNRNFNSLMKWCEGSVQTESADHPTIPGKKFIKIDAHNPLNTRQTKAYVGDWLLKTERGFKVYTHKAFGESFQKVKVRQLGTNRTTTAHIEKGADRSVEAQVQAEMEKI